MESSDPTKESMEITPVRTVHKLEKTKKNSHSYSISSSNVKVKKCEREKMVLLRQKLYDEAFDNYYMTELIETEKNNSKIQKGMELNVLEYSNES